MVVNVRETVEKERGLARTISSNINLGLAKSIIEDIEKEGYRVAGKDLSEYVSILTPSGKTIKWDFCDNLKSLSGQISDKELDAVSVYASYIYTTCYNGKKSLLFPNLRL